MNRLEPGKSVRSLLDQPGKRQEMKRAKIMQSKQEKKEQEGMEQIQENLVKRN